MAAARSVVVACGGFAARDCRMPLRSYPCGGRHEDSTCSSAARFCIALDLQGPVRADVVVGDPVFTDHPTVTFHKYVYRDVAWELGRRARPSVTATHDATAGDGLVRERVVASTGAGADR